MELPIRLSKESREPIYHQVENQLKELIAGGQLAAGTTLPSIRALSKDLEISIITTRRAYQNLESQGFIKTVQGKGTFVAEMKETLKDKVKIQSVYEAMEATIETAMRFDYTMEQIEEIFHEVLERYKKAQKGD